MRPRKNAKQMSGHGRFLAPAAHAREKQLLLTSRWIARHVVK
jgi:hypothetical protein